MTCGLVRCFTDDKDAPAIVLTTGSIPDAVQLDIEEA